jgi:hypothetical protein
MKRVHGSWASIDFDAKKQHLRKLFVGLSVFAVCGASANAQLNIIPTFDPSIATNANAAAVETAINSAITIIDGDISNPVTVTIDFGAITNGLGQSLTGQYLPTYSQYLNALKTVQTLSANDNIAIASLPAGPNNPVNGNTGVTATAPLLRALGFNTPAAIPGISVTNFFDSDIQFNLALVNATRPGSNPNNYDLQATAEHEINEVLGIGGSGSVISTNSGALTNAVGVLDLFRYSAPGVRSFTTSSNAVSFFSINGGTNKLVSFNQYGRGSDYSDWGDGVSPADGTGNNPQQVQDAFGTPGTNGVDEGVNELTALDVVGWNVVVPEPSTVVLVVFGLLGAWSIRRRKA